MARTSYPVGARFGRLTVVSAEPKGVRRNSGKLRIEWLCRCDCGSERYYRASLLSVGKSRSCGCLRKELNRAKKGISSRYETTVSSTPGRLRSYRSWSNMIERCYNSKNDKFKDYGARGIYICDRWRSDFDRFFEDMGERPFGLSIGRIDNNGPYAPDNCRWETTEEQNNNKRNTRRVEGEPLALLCKRLGLSLTHVGTRLRLGWTVEEAMHTPVNEHDKNKLEKEPPPPEQYYGFKTADESWGVRNENEIVKVTCMSAGVAYQTARYINENGGKVLVDLVFTG